MSPPSPNLIFLEIYLSKGSDLDLAIRIKVAYHDAIVNFLASYDSPENQNAAEQLGIEHVVPMDE